MKIGPNPNCIRTLPIIVTMEHVRGAKQCSRGAREWFKMHNLNYDDFLVNGMPVEKLESIPDAIGHHVAAYARKDYERLQKLLDDYNEEHGI